MYIYAGIDEAGYGPLFGPLLVSRTVMGVERHPIESEHPPLLWETLSKGVCRNLSKRHGRIPVNDSKKLHTPASGIKHLEIAVLSFASLAGHRPVTVDQWLDCLGESCHHDLDALPWYQPTTEQPWSVLPCANTSGELAVARSLINTTVSKAGVKLLDLGAAVVLEDRFNRMAAATRSKAATCFTFVAAHLRSIWDQFGKNKPMVVVDRQSGRVHYRELLTQTIPEAQIRVLDESGDTSSYRLEHCPPGQAPRIMNIQFQVDGDGTHMPVALASMISKYTRELLMARFKAWFADRAPQIKPTAGYGQDAKRFWLELQPILPKLSIQPQQLRRCL